MRINLAHPLRFPDGHVAILQMSEKVLISRRQGSMISVLTPCCPSDMDMALDTIVPESLEWRHTDEGPEWVLCPYLTRRLLTAL